MSAEAAVTVHNLSKCYQVYDNPQDRLLQMLFRGKKQYFHEFWALNNVSFEVQPGETFGIIGRNGSGKSTLLQILAGTLAATSGDVNIRGRVAALLELGSGFNMEFTGRENIFLNGRILGLSKEEIENRYDDIVSFADIGEYINQPVKTYSSGMFVRLAFAVQAHIDANVVIIDEALTVGDIFFRQKCYARIDQLCKSGVAILLVTHSMGDIEQYCSRSLVLDRGEQKFIGPSSQAVRNYYLINQSKPQFISRQSEELSAHDKRILQDKDDLKIKFPAHELFIDVTDKTQVGRGAVCTKLLLCDAQNNPCNTFTQGEEAIFYYEFQLFEEIEIPICGTLIKNDRGVIVHGKNNWHFDHDVPHALGVKSRILCKHSIFLNLQPGEYSFEVGLSAINNYWWQRRAITTFEEVNPYYHQICSFPDAGFFSVGFARQGDRIGFLTHHGVADLPGDMAIAVALE